MTLARKTAFVRLLPVFAIGLLLMAALIWGPAGCDDSHIVTYVNATDGAVAVQSGANPPTQLPAGSTTKIAELHFANRRLFIATRKSDGTTVFQAELSWSDLKQMGWSIVVR
jgi:hypothetical protein